MKITTLIFILTYALAHGQFREPEPTREQLKGYTKVTSRTYSSNSDSLSLSIAFINEAGDVTRRESYDEQGELVSWTRYEYDDEGRLKYEEDHGQVFKYDEQVKNTVGRIEDDTYNAKRCHYEKGLLARQIWILVFEGDQNVQYMIAYEYDDTGRLTREIHTDDYTGPVITFEPNSAIPDSAFNKGNPTQWVITYTYRSDTVVATSYDENNAVSGYSVTAISATGLPTSTLSADTLMNPIEVTSMTYDENDNLIRQTNQVIDAGKINYDKLAGDDTRIEYNEKGLPVQAFMYESGKLIRRTEIRYE